MAENTLNKELENGSINIRCFLGILLLVTVLTLSLLTGVRGIHATDPYTAEVLALVGDQKRGQEIFQMNCAVCHGIDATGEVGPSLLDVSARKSKVKLIKQVVSGKTPPMPQFQPEPQDMADLLKYLETL